MSDIKDVICVYWDSPVKPGDTCRVGVQFLYNGPGENKRVYAAIGNDRPLWQGGFDEVLNAYKDIYLPPSYPAGSWDSYSTFVDIPITSALDPAGSPYDLFGKVRVAWIGWEESPRYQGVIVVGGAPGIIDFSISRPTAYPYEAPAGPVLITCPVTSRSATALTAQVKCLVYEGSILPGHGDKLWEDTIQVTIAPGETKNVPFMRPSAATGAERRDVEVEVYVAGQLIVQKEWDDVFYVTGTAAPGDDSGAIFSGEIISVLPLKQRAGDEISLIVKYIVSTNSLLEAANGWWAEAIVDVDNMNGKAESGMLTGKGPKTLTQQLNFGAMPAGNLYGRVDIICFKGGFSGYSEVVATKNITLSPSSLPPIPPPQNGGGGPVTCSIDADCPAGYTCQDGVCVKTGETPWTWIAAGALALALLLPGKRAKKGK